MIKEHKTKLIQYGFLSLAILIVILVSIAILISIDARPKQVEVASKDLSIKIASANDRVSSQEIWRGTMEDKQQALKNDLTELKALIKNDKGTLQNKLEELNNTVLELNTNISNMEDLQNNSTPALEKVEDLVISKIQRLSLNLAENLQDNLKTIDTTIPAGSFVKAVLLSGVDAPSAIEAQADPKPLLLRLIDHSVLPRRFSSDLVDCHCVAAGWAELSSERLQARLKKLSCVERATGEIMQVDVHGYIAGFDGREGIRGTVVSKDGQFLTRSLWGGIFSGIGSALSPNNRRSPTGLFSTASSDKTPVTDMFKSGFADSSSQSLDKLSEYYIKRAEQIQPVIQIAAGQIVDLVFTESVSLDSTLSRQALAKKNDQQRKHTIGEEDFK